MNLEDEFPYGHYNYCDYRCEKCEFSGTCSVYQEELEAIEEGKDWQEVLEDSFEKTRSMIETFMEEEGIEVSPEDDDFEIEYKKIQDKAKKNPVHRLANDYMSMAMDFLKKCPPAMLVLSGLDEERDDLEYYCTLIPGKLHRTLASLYHFVDEEDDFHLVDAYLTSLVVYKALNKSLAAVEQMKKVMEGAAEELNRLEDLLLEIRIKFRREFPFEILLVLLKQLEQVPGKTADK